VRARRNERPADSAQKSSQRDVAPSEGLPQKDAKSNVATRSDKKERDGVGKSDDVSSKTADAQTSDSLKAAERRRKRLWAQALDAFDAMDYGTAIALLLELVQNDTAEYEIARRLAYAYRKNYRYEDALKWYEKLPLKSGEDAFEYAFTLSALGRHREAQSVLEQTRGLPGADAAQYERLYAACDSALKFQNLEKSLAPRVSIRCDHRPGKKRPLDCFPIVCYKTELDRTLSTEQSDHSPLIVEGDLVWTSRKPEATKSRTAATSSGPISSRPGEPFSKFMFIEIENGRYAGHARLLDGTFVQPGVDFGAAAYDPATQTLYYTRNVSLSSGAADPGAPAQEILKIYSARLRDGKWVDVKPLNICSNNYSTAHPALTPDGKTLFFAANKPTRANKLKRDSTSKFAQRGSEQSQEQRRKARNPVLRNALRDFDLYVSRFDGKKWSRPQNLSSLNTRGNEAFPYYFNGKLYFASDGRSGMGGYDLYVASGEGFSNVQNLNTLCSPVNTSYDEIGIYFTDSIGKSGYLTSNRPGGAGRFDIYRIFADTCLYCTPPITKLKPQKAEKLYVHQFPDVPDPLDDDRRPYYLDVKVVEKAIYKTYGKWNETKTYDLENVLVVVENDGREVDMDYTNRKGAASFKISRPKNLHLVLKTGSVELTRVPVSRAEFKDERCQKKIELEKVIYPVYFGFDSALVRRNDSIALTKLSRWLNDRPDVALEVVGHTCPIGSDEYNIRLSRRRAEAVFNFLRRRNVHPDRIILYYEGEYKLVTELVGLYPINRRTEIHVRKQKFSPADMQGLQGIFRN
ncbi:MAG: OmpA family protein, partial [Bacteroidia bacterium]|nr:OmpA family protein [Bacteroidia bacterium]